MAQRTTIELTDDLDGGDAVITKHFMHDGVSYEIDLSQENADAMDDALQPYIAAGRRVRKDGNAVKTRKHLRPDASGRARSKAIREWARANGFDNVPDRGRLSTEILEKFEAAHATSPSVHGLTVGAAEAQKVAEEPVFSAAV